MKKIQKKTYKDAYKKAEDVAKETSKNLHKKVFDKEKEETVIIVKNELIKVSNDVADFSKDVQKELNIDAKLKIKALKVEPNYDRIGGFLKRVASETYDKIKWIYDRPVENFCKNVVAVSYTHLTLPTN